MKIYSSIFIVISYLFFLIWARIFRGRYSISSNIFLEKDFLILSLYVLLFFMFLFLLTYNILQIYIKKKNINIFIGLMKNRIFCKMTEIFSKYVLDAPKNFYEWLYVRVKIKPFVDSMCTFIRYCDFYSYPLSIKLFVWFRYIVILMLPLIFIYSCYCYENLNLFYKSLFLLFIPMIIDLILYMIFDLSSKNKKQLEEWIVVKYNNETRKLESHLNISNNNNPLFKIMETDRLQKTLKFHGDKWYHYNYALLTIDRYYEIEKNMKTFFYIFVFSLYTLSWGFILLNIFFQNS